MVNVALGFCFSCSTNPPPATWISLSCGYDEGMPAYDASLIQRSASPHSQRIAPDINSNVSFRTPAKAHTGPMKRWQLDQ
jgi:hypothetical protein